eukprot:396280-Pyramimonas_sp.AAC.1
MPPPPPGGNSRNSLNRVRFAVDPPVHLIYPHDNDTMQNWINVDECVLQPQPNTNSKQGWRGLLSLRSIGIVCLFVPASCHASSSSSRIADCTLPRSARPLLVLGEAPLGL